MARRPQTSSATKAEFDTSYASTLESAGDIICLPWTGIDSRGHNVCPGFDWSTDRGLMAYIVPLVVIETEGLNPQYLGVGRGEAQADPKSAGAKERNEKAGRDFENYLQILKKWLRYVKIADPKEVVDRYYPKNEEHYIVVRGPYSRCLIGHSFARPVKGGFLVTNGIPVDAAQRAKEAQRVPIVQNSSPTVAVEKTASGYAVGAGGARARAASASFEAGRRKVSEGVPEPGDRRMRLTDVEFLEVNEPMATPHYSRQHLDHVLSRDPAYPWSYDPILDRWVDQRSTPA